MRARGVLALLAVACALVALAGWTPRGPAPQRVVVADESGGAGSALPLGPDGEFALAYRHSVYEVPALEHFVAEPRGGFRMVAVSSPREAVLDYYALSGARGVGEDGWWRLDLADPARYRELPLIATPRGRRTLVVGEHRLPLFTAATHRHLRLQVTPAES